MENFPNEIIFKIISFVEDVFDRFNFARTCQRFCALSGNSIYWKNISRALVLQELYFDEEKSISVNGRRFTTDIFSEFVDFLRMQEIKIGRMTFINVCSEVLLDILLNWVISVKQSFIGISIDSNQTCLSEKWLRLSMYNSFNTVEYLFISGVMINDTLFKFLESCGDMPKLSRFRFTNLNRDLDVNGDQLESIVNTIFPRILKMKRILRLELDLFDDTSLYVKTLSLPVSIYTLLVPNCQNLLNVFNSLDESVTSIRYIMRLQTTIPLLFIDNSGYYVTRLREYLSLLVDLRLVNNDWFANNFDFFVYKTLSNYIAGTNDMRNDRIRIWSPFRKTVEFETLLRSVKNYCKCNEGLRIGVASNQYSEIEEKVCIRIKTHQNFCIDIIFTSF